MRRVCLWPDRCLQASLITFQGARPSCRAFVYVVTVAPYLGSSLAIIRGPDFAKLTLLMKEEPFVLSRMGKGNRSCFRG